MHKKKKGKKIKDKKITIKWWIKNITKKNNKNGLTGCHSLLFRAQLRIKQMCTMTKKERGKKYRESTV